MGRTGMGAFGNGLPVRIFRQMKKVMNIRKFEAHLDKLDQQLWEANSKITRTAGEISAIEFLESKGYTVTKAVDK